MQIWCRQRENGNHFKYSSYAKRTMVTSGFLAVYLLSVLTVTVFTKDDDKTVFSGKIMPFERCMKILSLNMLKFTVSVSVCYTMQDPIADICALEGEQVGSSNRWRAAVKPSTVF